MRDKPIESASDEQVARRILGYLRENHAAGDTLEGIAKWWMMRQRVTETTEMVQRVVRRLNDAGLIQERGTPSGQTLYVASQPKR